MRFIEVREYDKPTIKLDVFIVPNMATTIQNIVYPREGFYGDLESLCNNNGQALRLHDKLVQLWWTNDDCDNWENRYPIAHIAGRDFIIRFATYDLPSNIIREWKEGVETTLIMPITLVPLDDPSVLRKELWRLNVTPKQKECRYSTYGDFGSTLRCIV